MPVDVDQARRGRDGLVGHLDDQLQDAAHQLRLQAGQLARPRPRSTSRSPSGSARRRATARRARWPVDPTTAPSSMPTTTTVLEGHLVLADARGACVDGRTDVQCKDFDDWVGCLAGDQGLTPIATRRTTVARVLPARATSSRSRAETTPRPRAGAAPLVRGVGSPAGSTAIRGSAWRCCWPAPSAALVRHLLRLAADPVHQRVLDARPVHGPRRARVHARQLPAAARARCSVTVVLRTVRHGRGRHRHVRRRRVSRSPTTWPASRRPAARGLLVVAVLMPLWASYLIKAYSWRLILAEDGVLNWLLEPFGPEGPGLRRGRAVDRVHVPVAAVHDPAASSPVSSASRARCSRPRLTSAARAGRRSATSSCRSPFPAVVAGSIFTFSLTLGDYIAPNLITSGEQFIGNLILANFGVPDLPLAAAQSLVPLAIMIVYLLVARRLGRIRGAVMSGRRWRDRAAGVATVVVLVFMYVPLALVIAYAFNESGTQAWPPTGFTLAVGPGRRCANTGLQDAFLTSVVAALGATLDRAHPGHAGRARRRAPPVLRPRDDLVRVDLADRAARHRHGHGAVDDFRDDRRCRWACSRSSSATPRSASCSSTTTSSRGMRRASRRRSRRRRRTWARDSFQTFRFVTFPAMRTAILAGALLAFALSFDEVIVTIFVAGRRARRCPIWIFQSFRLANQVALVNVAGLVAILLIGHPGLHRDADHERHRGRRPNLSGARATAPSAGRPRGRGRSRRGRRSRRGCGHARMTGHAWFWTPRPGLGRAGRFDPVEECPVSDPPPPVWRSGLSLRLNRGFAPGSVTSTVRSSRRGTSRDRPGTRAGSPCRRTSTWCRRARP